ncbi:MAG: endolytic transglycosylase MltG [Candidatus Marinimicrobia bacterium]|nr:endolytic transglycosylase MltG [Candidatus Neomarinimicrobiota bacterium]
MKHKAQLILLAAVSIALVGITSLYHIFDARPIQLDRQVVAIQIDKGASLNQIADQLYIAGVIRSPVGFKIAAHLLNRTRSFYPGNYSIETGLSNSEAIQALAHAKPAEQTITITEGLRSDEIIGLLSRSLDLDSLKMSMLLTDSSLLALAGPGFNHLEGALFPETYRFLESSDEYTVLHKLVSHFRNKITTDMLVRADTFGFDLYDLITFASLVEKETAREDERRLVSSVYHNRIRIDMLLNCDPTIIYMLVRRGEWDGNIRKRHFSIDDPYNSYMYKGLPPSPIANPGLASIEAALDPEESDYLYFVGKNDGTGAHAFSKTLRSHINKVNRYQRRGNRP